MTEDEATFLRTLEKRMEAFKEPCDEFVRFRELLDANGIEWVDRSDVYDGKNIELTMYRTQSPGGRKHGFSCIWGYGSYGADAGLLELWVNGKEGPEGFLTADEAIRKVLEARS